MNVLSRLIDSVQRRGVVATLGVVRLITVSLSRRAVDKSFDLTRHTDTEHIIETWEMSEVVGTNRESGKGYEATRPRPLRRVLRELTFADDSVFVDLGCGKGRALIVAAEEGFTQVVGIDFYAEVCDIASQNIEIIRRSGRSFEAEITCADILDFEFAAEYDVFFLFNPFDDTLLEQVIDRIELSVAEFPRQVWLIYLYPDWRKVIDDREQFSLILDRTYGGCEFLVYSNLGPDKA
jgi:SAM-dependent methyltransferase